MECAGQGRDDKVRMRGVRLEVRARARCVWCDAHRGAPLQQDVAVVGAQLEGGVAEGELDAEHLEALRLDRGAEEAEVVHLVLVAARVEEGRDADELAWWSVRSKQASW